MKHEATVKAYDSLKHWQLWIFVLLVFAALVAAGAGKTNRFGQTGAEDVYQAHRNAQLLQRAGAELAMERGLVFLALQVPLDDRSGWVIEAANRRAIVDAALKNVLGQAGDALWMQSTWPGKRMKGHLARFSRLRLLVDEQLAAPISDRSRVIADLWFRETTTIIHNMNTVLRIVHARIAYADPSLKAPLKFQRYASEIAELAGRHRALIAAAAAANGNLTPTERGMLRSYRLQIEESWRRVHTVARSFAVDESLTTRLDRAERELFRVMDETAGRIIEAGDDNIVSPLSAADWFAAVSRAIESVLAAGAVFPDSPSRTTRRSHGYVAAGAPTGAPDTALSELSAAFAAGRES